MQVCYYIAASKDPNRKGREMDAIITVEYYVHLHDEDAEAIENGEMDIADIDWSFYTSCDWDTMDCTGIEEA